MYFPIYHHLRGLLIYYSLAAVETRCLAPPEQQRVRVARLDPGVLLLDLFPFEAA